LNPVLSRIFKQGSKTYFYSSLFFPPGVKEDVYRLYSFVRKADDYVDTLPQMKQEFYGFRELYERSLNDEKTGDLVIDGFRELMVKRDFDPAWVESFLNSMESDLYIRSYETLEKLETYLYGSAEVVGLMMARILGLHEDSHTSARLLGRAMQYVNFVRDINEDLWLDRNYFPRHEYTLNGLESLDPGETILKPEGFTRFMRRQIQRYREWQTAAEEGFRYIPKRYLIPIKTASEMYKWTANVIERRPFIVYAKKVKPSIPRIVSVIGYNALFL
jgi:phytoene synthase